MAGGSYGYLWSGNFQDERGHLEAMAQRLEGLSWGGAAGHATRQIVRQLESLHDQAYQLQAVWQAIEWWDSDDSSEEDARKVVEAWQPPMQTMHVGPDPTQMYRLTEVSAGRYELRAITDGG